MPFSCSAAPMSMTVGHCSTTSTARCGATLEVFCKLTAKASAMKTDSRLYGSLGKRLQVLGTWGLCAMVVGCTLRWTWEMSSTAKRSDAAKCQMAHSWCDHRQARSSDGWRNIAISLIEEF